MEHHLPRSPEAKLARRDAVLAAVTRASELLSEPRPWELLVAQALGELGAATRVSRTYIFEVERRDGVDLVSQRFEWCAVGVTPQIDNPSLQGMPLDNGFTRWGELLRAGQPVFGDIGDFPESERPILEVQEIKSILVQPIFEGSRWWGFMGFDACEAVHSWERVEVDTLRIAALLLGAAIHRQNRESLLRESQKLEALGRMASSVAHDLNNFLIVISGAKQLLQDEVRSSGLHSHEVDSYSSMIDQAVARANALTTRLLEFSKRRTSVPAIVSLPELLRNEEPLLRQAMRGRARLRIVDDCARRTIAPVRIDPTELAQVALNLVVNACDAMPSGGEIVIDVSTVTAPERPACTDQIPDGAWTLLRVIDEGHGMDAEVLAQAFEPFFTTKANNQGTGLGLSTVKRIVQAAGGHARVSSAPGRGTEFRIYLPAHR
ncbi:MAG: GAF domain-containing protein [Phycisphaera sp.]|nr:GAF domain-containing protein [Phycisphaera sp.]